MQRMLTVPDFPSKGILFRDLTPVFAHGPSFRAVVDGLIEPFAGKFDAVAGLEARGFLLAAAAAIDGGVGVLPIRKGGKLPGDIIGETYDLEYGTATLEVNPISLPAGARVLVLDDVLATGGTINASVSLIERSGWTVAGIAVVLELEALEGRQRLAGREIHSLLTL
ncbi:adenine phosphoribosyltransferase [Aurantimicrobium minutum]|uniref:adenine phosphoribosyltransferase n=1 Tax=Aurantimicrobium minutum TaxID=708131 RepID=UPI00248E4D57|nr:adenine phosphoribosyltransferase [Aurantimicrobium minutum]